MSTPFDTLQSEALKLSAEERARLAERLLASLFQDEALESEWSSEVERRIAEIEAGRAKLIPAAEAINRARAAIK
jgi:putative addiction module component (TIGR02574 family)